MAVTEEDGSGGDRKEPILSVYETFILNIASKNVERFGGSRLAA